MPMAKYLVRYGVMRHLAILSARGGATFARGTKVIARTSRGLEVGEVLCEAGQEKFDEVGGGIRGPNPSRNDCRRCE